MQRRLIPSMLIAAALVCGVASAAPAPVQVTLSIIPAKTLPGLSVPLALKIRNSGGALELAQGVRVRVTPSGEEPFFAQWGENRDFGLLDLGNADGDPFTIGQNETVELSIPAVDLSQSSWALDPRLLDRPDTWTIEVLLYDDRSRDDVPVAVSSPATLRIEAPAAHDVAIWEAIQRKEQWAIAEEVFLGQPDSPYFPYLAGLVPCASSLDKVAILTRAIELHAATPVLPWLRFSVAWFYADESQHAFDVEQDLEKAVALADRGRAELVRLKDSPDAWGKMKGREKLEEHPSRDYFLDLRRLAREKGKRNE